MVIFASEILLEIIYRGIMLYIFGLIFYFGYEFGKDAERKKGSEVSK